MDASEPMTLMHASSRAEAQVVVALLRANGIPTYVDGQSLQDEFALSQRLMGLNGLDIQVPKSMLEQARRTIEEARRKGASADSRDTDPKDTDPGSDS